MLSFLPREWRDVMYKLRLSVMRCLSGCLSVCHVRVLCRNGYRCGCRMCSLYMFLWVSLIDMREFCLIMIIIIIIIIIIYIISILPSVVTSEAVELALTVTLRKTCQSCCRENVRIDGQWVWDYAVKFAMWQHRAMGRGATFVVPAASAVIHVCVIC